MPDEYISREAARRMVNQLPRYTWSSPVSTDYCVAVSKDAVLLGLDRIPAADVAEVVYCKDCRYGKYTAWCNGYACCRTVGEYHHADFGCTDGKLKTNGVAE